MSGPNDYEPVPGIDFDFDDADEGYEDCGLMPDGQCTRAGSEECDWDCGALNETRIRQMKERRGHD